MLSAKFYNLLLKLQKYGQLQQQQFSGMEFPTEENMQDRWMLFGTLAKGMFRVEYGQSPFARNDLNQELISIYSVGGKQKDVIADNIQNTYLGTVERAYHNRTHLPTRALGHLVARKYGQGHKDGIFADLLERVIYLVNR